VLLVVTTPIHPGGRDSGPTGLLRCGLLAALLACAPPAAFAGESALDQAPVTAPHAAAQNLDAELPEDSARSNPGGIEKPYRAAIARLEGERGAYAEGLSEQLLSLGLTLQRESRHDEALDIFKRGVHLARINHGLYSAEQLPLLQAEIASHLALGQLAKADERQQYLYRVQMRTLQGGESMAAALMQQASWQFSAYRWGVGGPGFMRLMNMWDLYRLALNDIVEREGETSPDLLPPLYGMLRAQYLISEYGGEQSAGFDAGDTYSGSVEYNRFSAYRNKSYDSGRAVIQAIYDVEQATEVADPVAAAEALVMLGDWYLWHQQREQALQAYADARAELVALDNAQQEMDRLFGQPVALPSLSGVRPMPNATDPESGDVLLQFSVTARGRVVDLERIDENEVDESVANNLLRRLRRTAFRPRFEDGEAVQTESIVWAYDIVE
jgi:tetratricopeptide (TPR) repeat protein